MNKDILIIIPAFNENRNIDSVVRGVKDTLQDIDVLVVDDGSTDITRDIAKKSGAEVISHAFNLGYGAALQTGYKYALMKGYKYILQMDADGQHTPEHAGNLLNLLVQDKADVIIGSRFLGEGGYKESMFRKIGRQMFSILISGIMRMRITDPTSGFIGMNERAIKFCTGVVYPVDYPDADMILAFHRAGLRLREVPITMKAGNGNGSMHNGISIAYYCFKMYLSIFLTLLRKPNA